jgi:hypothetical protein
VTENPGSYLRAFRQKIRTASTAPAAEIGMAYLEGFTDYMEGKCATVGCENDAEWEIASFMHLGCSATEIYCRNCGRALWYNSGLHGRTCDKHKWPSQVTYHPRKIGGKGKCVLCPTTCPVWTTDD